jgi:hypothetical protein
VTVGIVVTLDVDVLLGQAVPVCVGGMAGELVQAVMMRRSRNRNDLWSMTVPRNCFTWRPAVEKTVKAIAPLLLRRQWFRA